MAEIIDKTEEKLILTENLEKLVWKLSLPSIAAMVFFGLNTVSDAVFIGQLLGEVPLAGVALANPYIAIVIGAGYWIGTGAANILSIALGAKDEYTQKKILSAVAILSLVVSIPLALTIYVYAEELIKWTGGRGEALAYGVAYIRIALLGAPVWVYALSLNMVVRGEGKMKQSARMILYALLVNIATTPFFIKVLHLGVEGAAFATNVGMLALSLQGFLYFHRKKASFESNIHSFYYDPKINTRILLSGLPAFIFNLMAFVQAVLVFYVVNELGSEKEIAFYAATNILYLFLMTPLYGLMRAYQPLAGINFGALQYDRVKEAFILFLQKGFILILPFWFLLMLFPKTILSLLITDSPITTKDILNFRIYLFSLPFLPTVFMALSLFPSINQSTQASWIVLGRQLFLYIPVMLTLPKFIGLPGIYWGSSLVNIAIFLFTTLLLYMQFKKLTPKIIS